MDPLQIIPATTPFHIRQIETLAKEIWQEHFTSIIGTKQVAYMLDKFQSFAAITAQCVNGYEYFVLEYNGVPSGYIGILDADGKLFLSKLYLHHSARGKNISSWAISFLIALCKERNLSSIWLTCNKDNKNTLSVYRHFGFITTHTQSTDIGHGFIMDDEVLELVLF